MNHCVLTQSMLFHFPERTLNENIGPNPIPFQKDSFKYICYNLSHKILQVLQELANKGQIV